MAAGRRGVQSGVGEVKREPGFGKKTVITAVMLVFIASLIIPVFIGCFYMIPSLDDWGYIESTVQNGVFTFGALFEKIAYAYLNWQGTFFSELLTGLPVYPFWGLAGLRGLMLLAAFIFFAACGVCAYDFLCLAGVPEKNRLTAFIITVAASLPYLLGTNTLSENFYWFTGTQAYTVPLAFFLFGLASYMRYRLTPRTLYLAIASACAFLAGGGPLSVAAASCSVFLFCVLYGLTLHRKTDKSITVPVFALAGALVNAAAPGNFLRYENFDAGGTTVHKIITALIYSAAKVGYTLFRDMFRGGLLLILAAVMFAVGYKYLKNTDFKFPLPGAVALYSLFAMTLTVFPVVLGYGTTSFTTYLGERNEFVLSLTITLYTVLLSVYIGGFASRKKLLNFSKEFKILLVAMLVLYYSGSYAYEMVFGFIPYKMTAHILNGDFKEICLKEEDLIEQVAQSEDENVTVYYRSDSDGQWTNAGRNSRLVGDDGKNYDSYIAGYFGKNSVTVEYID